MRLSVDTIIRSVTTLLGIFTLIILGLIAFSIKLIDADIEYPIRVWGLISAGIILGLVVLVMTLLAVCKREALFYSVYAHILETFARNYGASSQRRSRRSDLNKKDKIPKGG